MLKDPSKSATTWLKKYLELHGIAHELTTQFADRFLNTLELAIRFGKVLIVGQCDELQPPLFEIVSFGILCRSGKKYFRVANKWIELHEKFRLILSINSNSNLQQMKQNGVFGAFITILPFTTTHAGLVDQLTAKSIQIVQPELETKRIELLKNESEMMKRRQELQEKLLFELSTSEGDLLSNEVSFI